MAKESDIQKAVPTGKKIPSKTNLKPTPKANVDQKGIKNYREKRSKALKENAPKVSPALPPQDVNYKKADKITWETIKENIPEELIPKPKILYIFGAIALIVILIDLALFPWFSFMNPQKFDEGLELSMGWPMHFFVMNLSVPEDMPIRFLGLIVDMLIYAIIAYLIEVAINYLQSTDFMQRVLGHGDYVDAKPRAMTPKSV